MVESRSMVRGESPGSGPSGPCACQQLAAHPVELTDMPPPEAAQEGAQGGWRLDHAAENTDRPTSTQRIGVVDEVAARQRGSDQRQQFVPRVRPPRGAAEVEVMADEFPQAQVPGLRPHVREASELPSLEEPLPHVGHSTFHARLVPRVSHPSRV